MQYANGKLSRVCDPCKIILQGKEAEKRKSTIDSGLSSPDDSVDRVHGVLDVRARETNHSPYPHLPFSKTLIF